jgi:uncharacterized membrane protein YeiH
VADQSILLLVLDLAGTFAFALDGAWSRCGSPGSTSSERSPLGIVTAIGGGVIPDLLIEAVPPATFSDWRYLAAATAGYIPS